MKFLKDENDLIFLFIIYLFVSYVDRINQKLVSVIGRVTKKFLVDYSSEGCLMTGKKLPTKNTNMKLGKRLHF